MRNFGSIISQWSNYDGRRSSAASQRAGSAHSNDSSEQRFKKNQSDQQSVPNSRRGTNRRTIKDNNHGSQRPTVRGRVTEHKSYYKKGTMKKKKTFKIGPANIDNLDDENSEEEDLLVRKVSGSFDEFGSNPAL